MTGLSTNQRAGFTNLHIQDGTRMSCQSKIFVTSHNLKESLLDEVDKFRSAIVRRMTEDGSRNPLDTFEVDRLPSAWKAWKTGRDATGNAQFDELRQEEV